MNITAALAPGESLWIAETFPLPWAHCQAFMEALPEIAEPGFELERLTLGQSEQGRPILAARVSGGGKRPALVLIGGAARRRGERQALLRNSAGVAVAQRETPEVREILSRYEVLVAPEVNPDGCYDGRMNTNARGVVMNSPDDDSSEMCAQLRLVDEARPRILVDCHGWGNTIGTPPYEGWYRRRGEDPFFEHVVARVPGAATSTDHFLDDVFRLESHARDRLGAHVGILEINWNYIVRPDGSVAQPTLEDLRARSLEYFRAIATMPSD